MSDFVFTNIILATYVALFLGFPILTLIQIMYHRTYTHKEKLCWVGLVFITWPLFMAGSLVFAFKNYPLTLRFIPIALTFLVVGGSIIGSHKILDKSSNASLAFVEHSIAEGPQGKALPPAVRHKIESDIQFLKSEMTQDGRLRGRYPSITAYLSGLFLDGFDDNDFKKWNYVFENRATLSDTELEEFIKNNP